MWVIVEVAFCESVDFISQEESSEQWIHCIDLVSRQRDHYGFRFYILWIERMSDTGELLTQLFGPLQVALAENFDCDL